MKNGLNEVASVILWMLVGFWLLQAFEGRGKQWIAHFFQTAESNRAPEHNPVTAQNNVYEQLSPNHPNGHIVGLPTLQQQKLNDFRLGN